MILYGLGVIFSGLLCLLRGWGESKFLAERGMTLEESQAAMGALEYLLGFANFLLVVGFIILFVGLLLKGVLFKGKCPRCGHMITRGEKYCAVCGNIYSPGKTKE